MAELKTKENDASVEAFLDSVEDEKKRKDSYTDPEPYEGRHQNRAKNVGGQHRRFW